MNQIIHRRSVIRGAVSLAAVGVSNGCGQETQGLNLILKIIARIGGRPVEGSGIIHIGSYHYLLPSFDNMGESNLKVTGDAVTLDLGNNRKLFGLLMPPESTPSFGAPGILDILAPYIPPDKRDASAFRYIQTLSGEYAVPRNQWPAIVRFRDARDPMTVQILDPAHLPEEYGAGSQIETVLLQVTDKPVNFHIEKELPWLLSLNGNLAGSNGSSGTRNDAEKIMYYDFKLRGEK